MYEESEDFNSVVDLPAQYLANFTILPDWLFEFSKTNSAAITFFYQFRLMYGGLNGGVYKNQKDVAAQVGSSESTVRRCLTALVKVGALSVGRRHRKWAGNIYFFNSFPHEHDETARTYHLARSYKPGAKLPQVPVKPYVSKAPESKQTVDISACTSSDNAYQMLAKHYAKLFPEQEGITKALLLDYLDPEGNIKQAVNGLYEMKAKGWKISQKAFENSLKERGDFIPKDLEQAVNKQRDKVNLLRRLEAEKASAARNAERNKADLEYRKLRAQKEAELKAEKEKPLSDEEILAALDFQDIQF